MLSRAHLAHLSDTLHASTTWLDDTVAIGNFRLEGDPSIDVSDKSKLLKIGLARG
jgi:hypothetical protein